MSFGASAGDIIIILQLAKTIFKRCRQAGGEYVEISREVRSLHSVLRNLKDEIEDPASILNRENSNSAKELVPIIGNCDATLQQLDGLLQKYCNINGEPGLARLWDRMRFGTTEMEELAEIRMKLMNHKTTITVFTDAVQLKETGRLATQINKHGGHLETHGSQLQSILDKVDGIAVRMGQQAGSRMTAYDNDDTDVWRQFRRELIDSGISSELLIKYKDVLRQHIRVLEERGVLDEMPPDSATSASSGVDPQLWLKDIPIRQDAPPSFNAIHDRVGDPTMKERVWREEDMKFLQSMKTERAKGMLVNQDRDIDFYDDSPHHRSAYDSKARHFSPPRQNHSPPELLHVENPRASDDASSSVDDVAAPSIMRTADLVHSTGSESESSRAARPRPPRLQVQFEGTSDVHSTSVSPKSARSQASFAHNDRPHPSITQAKAQNLVPDNPTLGTTPSTRVGDTPRSPASSPRTSNQLAPDASGNEIPADAKWTRIKRSIVSTEVLDCEGYRYEARPDFVAVLGILSRDKVADLAERSHAVRSARRSRYSNAAPHRPLQPPRSSQYVPSHRHGRDTSSDEDYDSPSSSTASDRHTHPRRTKRRPESRHTEAIPIARPVSQQYQPMQAPGQGWLGPAPQDCQRLLSDSWSPGSQVPPRAQGYMPPNEGRRHGHGHSPGPQDRRREQPRRNWRDNLATIGIGGAAASFISVIGESIADLDI